MSRSLYADRKDAQATWPVLTKFLNEAVHGDDDTPVSDDLDRVIARYDLDLRQKLAREWWNWNGNAATSNDIRSAVEALDPNILVTTAAHARSFMNGVYDKVVVSIRAELGKEWKP